MIKSKHLLGKLRSSPVSPETAKNAARERTRVRSLRSGFQRLQAAIPSIPPDTKLSKLDVLILAISHISRLSDILSRPNNDDTEPSSSSVTLSVTSAIPKFYHPVKKWPMRSRLYADSTCSVGPSSHSSFCSPEPQLSPVDSTTPDTTYQQSYPMEQYHHQLVSDTCQTTPPQAPFVDHIGNEWDFLSYDFNLETSLLGETNVTPLTNLDIDSLISL